MRNDDRFIEKLVSVVPSERQLRHQKLEFYAFFHFSINTYTGREWGDGTESPSVFAPKALDARQWVKAVKAAGMKGAILTCKHHDGFCLWPSRYTGHSVASSPYKNGLGDVVREVSDACRAEGLEFGVYLSPWDRNHTSYGKGKKYDDYFTDQLTELLTGYGDIFCVWLDGACGEGKDGNVQIYDWERYYETIRALQPNACISVCGPDVRWCGNEAGDTRPEEWSVVPARLRDAERIKEKSQNSEDTSFREKKIQSCDLDLGSRRMMEQETEACWYPAEVDVSIRPGWFYHEEEDEQVRSLEELIHIYDSSVGGNTTLLLNIPPTKEGLIHENDRIRLQELGVCLRKRQQHDYAAEAIIENSIYERSFHWEQPVTVSMVVLMEDIRHSQRVEEYVIKDQDGTLLYEGKTIGYKKHAVFEAVKVTGLTVSVKKCRMEPIMESVRIY